ncbi:hypothetical protein I314_01085, partial [Cryptococcus bacillisporus CA1873]
MFRPAIARPAASLARPLARTFVSRATFVGRLGTAPEKSTTTAGQPYYKYPLAVSKPPKRDADGSKSPSPPPARPAHHLQRSSSTKAAVTSRTDPVRADPSWFTIFNFNERAEARIESLVPGSLLYVEGTQHRHHHQSRCRRRRPRHQAVRLQGGQPQGPLQAQARV